MEAGNFHQPTQEEWWTNFSATLPSLGSLRYSKTANISMQETLANLASAASR